MAIKLDGSVDLKRVSEFLNKVLGSSDLANYRMLIDNISEDDSKSITLSQLLSFVSIADNSITNAKLAQIAENTIKGRITAGTGNVEDLTVTQVTSMLNVFTDLLKGLVPASGGGTANFLRADGTWATPAGGSFIDYYDATVGTGGDYTTITAAIAANKYVLKQVGAITEAGAIGAGTYDVTVVGDNSLLITLGAGLGSRIRFYNCNVSITGSGVNGRYTFDRCLVTMNGGFCTNNVKFINGCEITHVSGLGIYNANVSDSTIYLNGNSAYMGYISNCIINYTSGNGFIYNGRFSNCYSSATLTFLQCRINQSEFLNSAFNASSANASLTGGSIINNVVINALNVKVSDSTINDTAVFSATTGSNSKLNNCTVVGLLSLQAGAQANIITGNHLNSGYTDSSGSSTNIIKNYI